MGFISDLFGGPNSTQKDFADRENTMAATLFTNYNQQFAGQTGVLDNLHRQLTPIANLGPNQQGYSPQDLAAQNTAAINNAGAAARNAQQRVAGTLAGQGGGSSSGLVSGIQEQIQGTIASNSANQLADAQNQITQNNYETGRKNFWQATAGEDALAKAYNPESYAALAGKETGEASASADKIQAMKHAAAFAPLSLGIGLASKAIGFGAGGLGNLDTAGTSSFGEQVGNFFKGGFSTLAGGGE